MDTEPVAYKYIYIYIYEYMNAMYSEVTHRSSTDPESAHSREHARIHHIRVWTEIISPGNHPHTRVVTGGAYRATEAKSLCDFKDN